MQEIVKIQKSEGGKDIVFARELYENLGLDLSHWSKWYKKNIENNGLAIENTDYIVLAPSAKTSEGGRPTKDFAITLDFAKRLSMMTRTPKGEEIRNYFIECERLAKQQIKPVQEIPSTYAQALLEAGRLALENEKKDLIIKELEPLAKVAIKVLGSKSDMTTTTIAKELGMSAIELNKILHENRVQYYQDEHWVLYADYKDKGYTKLHTFTRDNQDGTTTTKHNTKWTEKGRAFISEIVKKHFEKMDKQNLSFSKAMTSVVSTTYRQTSLQV